MGAALANDNALDRRPAVVAGLTSALVDMEIVLEITAPIDPINAGALALDAVFQHLADAGQQAGSLGLI